MTKTQDAERIALDARVFVRRARREGHVNLITEMLLQECAQSLRLFHADCWTIRKAARITVTELINNNEADIIDWTDDTFRPLMPGWMR
jgi:hypothetical protein